MDVIHKVPVGSIYVQTQYLVNSDMTIPFALAGTWNYGVATEGGRRPGMPQQDRMGEYSPLVLQGPKIPKGK